ncbi:MAG: putative glycoside hydrolase, partial [Bacilli bacterium]|nr:putative glycoside hydrolase [Bacilli bacterium]
MKRKLKWKNIILTLIALILIIIFLIILTSNKKEEVKEKYVHLYISSKENMASLYDLNNEKIDEVNRGYKIIVNEKNYNDENDYIEITYNNKKVFVLKEDLVKDRIEIVKEKEIYVRTHTTLYENINNSKINGVSNKGEKLEVIGYDQLLDTGEVNAYKILKDGIESYVYAKYIVLDEEEALLHYEPDKYYNIHENRRDFYSNAGGTGASLDYYPFTKPIFEDNIMPEKVYAFYLNGGRNIIGNIDAYIEYAKKTKINAFVVDIKDYKAPAYKSKVYEKMSPTNYKYAINSFDNYKNAIKKLKDNGFYVIGRITAFKDDYLVKDNPEVGIYDKRYNKSFDDGTWPSAFSRFVWEFNIELA